MVEVTGAIVADEKYPRALSTGAGLGKRVRPSPVEIDATDAGQHP
jgi:hypothetical protein